MTSEQRTVIEISDIAGFEFECPRCQSRVYVPVEKFDDLKQACPNCREPWFRTVGGPDHLFIRDLLQTLRDYQKMKPEPMVKLRLQLKS